MTDHGFLFSAPMVRALLAGTKTQTRRLFTPRYANLRTQPKPGDRMWVRETCRAKELRSGRDVVEFMADKRFREIQNSQEAADRWVKLNHYGQDRKGQIVPSIHMPRWASRLTLLVTDVRVQRLHEATEADCKAEGVEMAAGVNYRGGYSVLWNSLHTLDTECWDANPMVIALTFDVRHSNIDLL